MATAPIPAETVRRAELAARLGVTCRTVDNWILSGIIPAPIRPTQRCCYWTREVADQIVNGAFMGAENAKTK